MITTGGENVGRTRSSGSSPTHRNVAEVAVWKRPDPEWGERVVAWVVPAGDTPRSRGAEGARRRHRRPLGGPQGDRLHRGAARTPRARCCAAPCADRSRRSSRRPGPDPAPAATPPAPDYRRLRPPHPRPDPRAWNAVPGPSRADCPRLRRSFARRVQGVPGLEERHPEAPAPGHGHDHPWLPDAPGLPRGHDRERCRDHGDAPRMGLGGPGDTSELSG